MKQLSIALSRGVLVLALGGVAAAEDVRDEWQDGADVAEPTQREEAAATPAPDRVRVLDGDAVESSWELPVYVPPSRGAPAMRIGGGSRGGAS